MNSLSVLILYLQSSFFVVTNLECNPVRLKNRARALGFNSSFNYGENWKYFLLNETSQINFETYRARDYYRLLLVKKHQSPHTAPERWERDISIDTEIWTDAFKMASKTCKENKLQEFQFKFIHRIDRTGESLCYNGIWLEILEKLGIGCFH